jgi:hypothetical protein
VSKESKVLIGVGAVVVVAVILALTVGTTVGLIVAALGLIGAYVATKISRPDTDDPFAEARTQADETQVGNLTVGQPLAPWSPEGGLNAWTPPVSLTGLPDAPPLPPAAPVEEPTAEPSTAWSNEWNNDDSWQSTTSFTNEHPLAGDTSTDTNPLDELQGLDSLDPIAEVERIDARTADETATEAPESDHGFSFGGVSRGPGGDVVDLHAPVVNEDVSGADDIMAASQATELHLADGEQTELQKLLAKVQIRLSAYE